MRCWCGYLSGVKWKWLAYGVADATVTPSSLFLQNPEWFIVLVPAYLGCAGKRPLNECCCYRCSLLLHATWRCFMCRPSGLLVGQLDHSSFYERRNAADYRIHLLPLEGQWVFISTDRVNVAGNTVTSVCPSVCLFPLYLRNQLTIDLELFACE